MRSESINERFCSQVTMPSSKKISVRKLLGGAVSNDRKMVLAQYAEALTMMGDRDRGHATYRRVCANCHRIGTEGIAVGPDIGDVL